MKDWSWQYPALLQAGQYLSENKALFMWLTFFVALVVWHIVFVYPSLRSKVVFKYIDYAWLGIALVGVWLAGVEKDVKRMEDVVKGSVVIAVSIKDSVVNRIHFDRILFCNSQVVWKGVDNGKLEEFCDYITNLEWLFEDAFMDLIIGRFLRDDARWLKSMYDDNGIRPFIRSQDPSVDYIINNAQMYYEQQKKLFKNEWIQSRYEAERVYGDELLYALSKFWILIIPVAVALRMTKATGEILHDKGMFGAKA